MSSDLTDLNVDTPTDDEQNVRPEDGIENKEHTVIVEDYKYQNQADNREDRASANDIDQNPVDNGEEHAHEEGHENTDPVKKFVSALKEQRIWKLVVGDDDYKQLVEDGEVLFDAVEEHRKYLLASEDVHSNKYKEDIKELAVNAFKAVFVLEKEEETEKIKTEKIMLNNYEYDLFRCSVNIKYGKTPVFFLLFLMQFWLEVKKRKRDAWEVKFSNKLKFVVIESTTQRGQVLLFFSKKKRVEGKFQYQWVPTKYQYLIALNEKNGNIYANSILKFLQTPVMKDFDLGDGWDLICVSLIAEAVLGRSPGMDMLALICILRIRDNDNFNFSTEFGVNKGFNEPYEGKKNPSFFPVVEGGTAKARSACSGHGEEWNKFIM